jgi:hypothetical protein
MCVGIGFYSSQDLWKILGVIEVHTIQAQSPIKKVRMTIGEAWQNQPASRVYDSRLAAAVGFDVLRTPDREDLVSTYGNRLRPRLLWVHRVNAGIENNNVGSGMVIVLGVTSSHHRNKDEDKLNDKPRTGSGIRSQAFLSELLGTDC